MTTNEDERIQADVNDRLAAELPADAAQIQVDVTRSSPRALRAWSPSWTICACASRAGRVRPADRASNHSHSAEAVFRRA
jgi:hypothetical protein